MAPTLESVAPYFVLMAAFVLLGALTARAPFLRAPAGAPDGRLRALDGLRGFLALSVLFAHAVVNARFRSGPGGAWQDPPSIFYTLCGRAPVAVFFMITGFLFWSKAVRGKGHLGVRALYASRARRILPLYCFAMALLFVLVGFETGWTLHVPAPRLLGQLARWLCADMLGMPDVNGLPDTFVLIAGVVWTLRYEWAFTLVLPALALLYTKPRFALLAAAALVPYLLTAPRGRTLLLDAKLHTWRLPELLDFVLGMSAAYLAGHAGLVRFFHRPASALVPAAALIALWLATARRQEWVEPFLLFLFFLPVVLGNALCGLLTSRGAQHLGRISYGIYLLHGLVLAALFALRQRLDGAGAGALDGARFWALVLIAGAATIALATVTHRFIEQPFLARSSTAPAAGGSVLPARA